MKKIFLQAVSIILVMCTLISGTASAADTPSVEPAANSFISSNSAKIVSTGGGNFYVQIYIQGQYTMSQIGATRIKVYNSDGDVAFNVAYTTTGYSHLMAYNKSTHATTAYFAGDSGESYYAVVYFYVRCTNPAGSGSHVYTTSTVKV